MGGTTGSVAVMTMTLPTTPTALPEEVLDGFRARAGELDRANAYFDDDLAELRSAGYLAAAVPTDLGGWGLDLAQLAAAQRRLARYAPATALSMTMHSYWIGAATAMGNLGDPSLRWILEAAAGGEVFAAGHAETGNDIPVLLSTCQATRVEGGWRLDGQKTWTTRGAFCTHLFGLFRTDPDSARHKGLTYLLVPLDTPGVIVRGFGRLDGDEGFAEVFFDDAFLADDAVPGGVLLGDEGAGWKVAMATTGSERGLTLRSPGRFLATAARLIDLHDERVVAGTGTGGPLASAPSARLRERIADVWMRAEAYRLFTLDTVTRLSGGAVMGADSSINKIWWSELDCELHEIALELLGPDAEVEGPWSKGWQFSLSGPIYAGTNEIQRNIAAERVLGLPRR